MRIVVVCLIVLIFWVNPVFCLPVTFDFSDSSSNFQFIEDSLALNVSAGLGSVTETSRGLGVDAGGSDSNTLDSSGAEEALWFAFSESVRLLDVAFYWVDDGESFALSLGSANDFGWDRIIPLLSGKAGLFDFFAAGPSSSLFGIRAGDDSSFRVSAMTVEPAPIPTPEPSTFLLLSAGALGMVWWRRR